MRGLRDRIKRKNIFEFCRDKGSNIVFLQETYSTVEVEEKWKSEWNGQLLFSHGTNHSKGVLVLISPNINMKIRNVSIGENGRYIIMKLEYQQSTFLLVNCYFPTRDKEKMQIEFLDELENCISKIYSSGDTIILGGDFNMIMNGDLDYMGPRKSIKNKFNEKFEDLMDRLFLVDIWRKKNPEKKQFTFRQKWPVVQSRLDYWFVSSTLQDSVNCCDILTSITPDHSGVLLQLRNYVNAPDFGNSYWKFNNSLCVDQEFVRMFKDKVVELKAEWMPKIKDILLLWDFLKMKMRQFISTYTKEKAKVRKNEIKKIEKEIEELENKLLSQPLRNIIDEIDEKKSNLNKLYDYSRQGLKIRSRAVWFEEGEQKTQYFEQLLKSNKRKSVIKELYDDDDHIIKDRKEILKKIGTYYENLYSLSEAIVNENSLFLKDIPQLSKESCNICEGRISIHECLNVLKEMKYNKSPGNDGFTVEFYYTFWNLLGGLLVDVLNETYERGKLTISQKQGVITLLEKKGKDPLYVQNFRPITLLNVDYKILSKVLAKRLKGILNEIIHNDQVGYVKDRNIGDGVRLIDDMLYQSNFKNIGYLITVDFEKAFDSVSHDFLFKILKLFGFGHSFCSWVRVLYSDITSSVMNGGFSSGYFNIERGVRQGDPLSPYLFLLCIEILALAIRKDRQVEGIQFQNHEIKQILYADDISLFVKNTHSLDRLQYLFEEFEKISGLKINKGKTNILWMGRDNDRPQTQLFGNFVQHIKILGVYFSLNVVIKEDMNYKEILSKIKRLLGWWKQRDLTLMGKIHLLKTYALSRLNFVSSLILVPQWLYAEVEKITFEFLWSGKDRIKRIIMYQDYSQGGLKMMNFKLFVKSQRLMWLKRLLYGERDAGWKLYFDFCFRSVGGRFLFLCDFDTSKLNIKMSPFYSEMMKAWQDLRKFRYSEEEVNPIIFNNQHICIKGKTIFDNDLFNKGIFSVDQIFDNGHLKPVTFFQNLGITANQLLQIIDIVHVIPASWKICNSSIKFKKIDFVDFGISMNIGKHETAFEVIKSKTIYNLFITKLQELYKLTLKDGHSDFDFTDVEICKLFEYIRSTTLIRKQREFQFMLLHGAIYTKEHLMRFGFVGDNYCSFCCIKTESYFHILMDCIKVKPLWQFFIDHFCLAELRTLNWREIFLGLPGNSSRIKCVNSVILFIKYAIFNSRAEGRVPSFIKIHKYITGCIEEERRLATKSGKLSLHLQKWDELKVKRVLNVNR